MRCRLLELEPGVEAPGIARASLRVWLTTDALDYLEQDVLLVVSELVTDAAVHAATAIELSYETAETWWRLGSETTIPTLAAWCRQRGTLRLPNRFDPTSRSAVVVF